MDIDVNSSEATAIECFVKCLLYYCLCYIFQICPFVESWKAVKVSKVVTKCQLQCFSALTLLVQSNQSIDKRSTL